MTKKALYSTTPASNATGVTGVNWAEGQLPSTVNNSAREMMAIEASWLADNQALTTGGTTSAYTVTTSQGMATPADGDTLGIRWNATCAATPTLAVDAGTARAIVHANGEAVAAGDFQANGVAKLTYRLSNTTWYAQGGNASATVAQKAAANTFTAAQTISVDDATNAGVSRPLVVQHSTSGTAGAGIGVGISYKVEDASGNIDEVMRLDYVATDATNASEDGDFVVTAMVAGALTEIFRSSLTGLLKRTAGYSLAGTNTNDSAATGYVGEIIESEILVGSAVALTTATPANVTSISLTVGDWDVWGNVVFAPAGGTTMSSLAAAINTVSATFPTAPGKGAEMQLALTSSFTTGAVQILSAGQRRISIGSTTTVYLVAQAGFAASTMGAYGYLGARRVR